MHIRRQEATAQSGMGSHWLLQRVMIGLVGDLVVRAVGVAASMALGFLVLAELLSMQ